MSAGFSVSQHAFLKFLAFSVGCNVENASYGGTICAERSAIVSAVSQGYTKFRAIAVVTELSEPASPCGLCRQFLVEFGDYKVRKLELLNFSLSSLQVVVGTASNNKILITSTRALLPFAFTPESLDTFEQEKASEAKGLKQDDATEHNVTVVS